jgi:poly-beta-hydroxyalkanoate depolymerase
MLYLAYIRKTMLLTVEDERDDICTVGQTVAAHDLSSKLRPYLRRHRMRRGVRQALGESDLSDLEERDPVE